jgi:chaperonin cofactor prefoldin
MAITISDTEPRVQYTATAGQTSFTVPFEFFANADLKVFNGTTELSFAASPADQTEYSVSGAGQTGGGSITLGAPGATLNDVITIYRDLAIERTTDFPTSGAFQINSLNTELDKIIAMAQQLERDLKFSPRAAATTANTFDITFPNLVANKVLSVNSAGNGLEFAQDVTDITTIAGIASDITTVSGIAADVTAVANDASDIGVVATNIASINTVATNIADVITVANDLNEAISEVETVADDLNEAVSEIDTVSNNITDVQTVGNATNINNITLVAGQISPTNNIATIAGLSTEIGQVAAIDSEITTVANNDTAITNVNTNIAIITNVNTNLSVISNVNTNLSDIQTVSTNLSGSNTIGTVATDLSGSNTIGTVATNITDVQDVAANISGINSFADRYRVASSDPTTSLDAGDLAFNTSANVLKYYNGSTWEAIVAGGLTDIVQDGTPQLGGNLDVNGNSIVSVSGGDIAITPDTTGKVVIDGLNYPTTDGASGQAIVTDGSGNLSFGTTSSPEVYGFSLVDTDADGVVDTLRLTTTNQGADNISASDYANFDDVQYAASGMTWSITSDGNLRVTI